MRKFLICCFLHFIFLFGSAAMATPATKETVLKLIDKTQAAQLGVDTFHQMMSTFAASGQIPAEMLALFKEEAKADELAELLMPIYQKHLSEEDIQGALEFYETEAGKNMIKTLPAIMLDSAAAGEVWGERISERVMERMVNQ